MDTEQKIKELEKMVAELEAWKEARTRQQLTYPLDKISQDILHENVPVFTGQVIEDAGIMADGGVDVKIDGRYIRLNIVFL